MGFRNLREFYLSCFTACAPLSKARAASSDCLAHGEVYASHARAAGCWYVRMCRVDVAADATV
eukprot:3245454-Pleurochrysis_carterae.AAC.1